MGLLGKLAAKAAVKVAENVALTATLHHLDKHHSKEAIINHSTASYRLIVEQATFSVKRKLYVTDEAGNKKYIIKNESSIFDKFDVALYDINEKKLGYINKEAFTFGKTIYNIHRSGSQCGQIIRKNTLKTQYDVSYKGWKIEGDFLGWKYNVVDRNGNTIMKIQSAFSSRDAYVIEYEDQKNEVMCLLLAVALDAIRHIDR